MKRYKADNILSMTEDVEGAFVLFDDAAQAMAMIGQKAVEAGADEQKLMELLNEKPDH